MSRGFDWQSWAVLAAVLGALLYVVRRAAARLRSFTAGGRAGTPSCAAGCGKCGGEAGTLPKPPETLVQIDGRRTPRRGREGRDSASPHTG